MKFFYHPTLSWWSILLPLLLAGQSVSTAGIPADPVKQMNALQPEQVLQITFFNPPEIFNLAVLKPAGAAGTWQPLAPDILFENLLARREIDQPFHLWLAFPKDTLKFTVYKSGVEPDTLVHNPELEITRGLFLKRDSVQQLLFPIDGSPEAPEFLLRKTGPNGFTSAILSPAEVYRTLFSGRAPGQFFQVSVPVDSLHRLSALCQAGIRRDWLKLYSIERIFADMLAQRDSSRLFQVTFPDSGDTFSVDRVRFGAWVRDTSAQVTLEGEPLKVYPTGAVADQFHLKPGWNAYRFVVATDTGREEHVFGLFRTVPPRELPVKPTRIEKTSLHPAQDQVFYGHDRITVRMTGSPGGRASFRIRHLTPGRLPMTELPPEQTGGLKGIYEGVYYLRDTDHCQRVPVKFRLKGPGWCPEKERSRGTITVLPDVQPRLLETVGDNNLVWYLPGGEILTELPPGIILRGIADLGEWWKVALSAERSGYVPESSLQLLPPGRDFPEARLTSISSEVDSHWVTIRFRLSDKVPFKFTQHTQPQKISVYFYRTRFQDEWSVYPYPDPLVDHYDWIQEEDDILRFDVYLAAPQQWGFRGKFEGNNFLLKLRRPPRIRSDNPFRNLIIALDAGHGGEHRGAVGATGLMEKDMNLVYTQYLARMLSDSGATVVVTRPADSTMSLGERVDIARAAKAHLLVWMHNNASGWTRHPLEISGTSTYYTHLQGWPFARATYPRLLELGLAESGMVHRTYYVTRQPDLVIYLVEGAFLSHPGDELYLSRDANLQALARAVFAGLKAQLLEMAQ